MYTKKQKVEIYAVFLLIVLVIELFMAIVLQKGFSAYYNSFHHLDWVLPRYLSIPIWSIMYILYAIAGASIWIKRKSFIRKYALASWVIVIFLNILWPITFFYIPLRILTPIILSVLFISLLVLLFYSFLASRLAGYLLIPITFMILYLLLLHWTLFIINIQVI